MKLCELREYTNKMNGWNPFEAPQNLFLRGGGGGGGGGGGAIT